MWSTNTDWFTQAVQLCHDGTFDLIELYIVPGTTSAQLRPLIGTPIRLHAPHENHGFNAFTLTDRQVKQFQSEVSQTATELQCSTIVVHAGVGQDDQVFAKQIDRLDDSRIIIENMPYAALDRTTCYGYALDQLAFIHQTMRRELCIDFGHAVKSAVSQGLDYKTFLTDIVTTLQPSYFHISDGDPATDIDEHLNLGSGTYDLAWMKQLLDAEAKARDIVVVFEVPKNGVDLGNDIANTLYWRQLQ